MSEVPLYHTEQYEGFLPSELEVRYVNMLDHIRPSRLKSWKMILRSNEEIG